MYTLVATVASPGGQLWWLPLVASPDGYLTRLVQGLRVSCASLESASGSRNAGRAAGAPHGAGDGERWGWCQVLADHMDEMR